MKYADLDDKKLCQVIENRWISSADIWDEIESVTKRNTAVYDGKNEWLTRMPLYRPPVTANRVFVNTEAVINSLIANPPTPNTIPGRDSETSKIVARNLEKILLNIYEKENVKEVFRQSLRDLYFSRLMVLKPYWDVKKNNVAVRRVDPRKVRFSKDSKNESESEFAIEEIPASVSKIIERFPGKKEVIIKESLISEKDLLIEDPEATYKECWFNDYMCVKYRSLILFRGRNPYWDWDGLIATREELDILSDPKQDYSEAVGNMKTALTSDFEGEFEGAEPGETVQDYRGRVTKGADKEDKEYPFESFLFNYFDYPRKPYIFATVLNNENKPIGRTSFIEESTGLQFSIDHRKFQIDQNADTVNGITKVDSTVMSKSDAQGILYDAGGVIYGRGVVNGVQREFGSALPQFVVEDMLDSREEIDNIMAASSAFRGERQGQETKAGRLALIEQSSLRLNEMVQVIDYVNQELFGWWMQLMKSRYTERHFIKDLGPDGALETYSLMQDDLEDGIDVRVIPGKTLPRDHQFMYERAQNDVEKGYISPLDYLEDAGYENPKEKAKNAFEFANDPAKVLGITPEAPAPMAPPQGGPPMEAEALAPQSVPVGA